MHLRGYILKGFPAVLKLLRCGTDRCGGSCNSRHVLLQLSSPRRQVQLCNPSPTAGAAIPQGFYRSAQKISKTLSSFLTHSRGQQWSPQPARNNRRGLSQHGNRRNETGYRAEVVEIVIQNLKQAAGFTSVTQMHIFTGAHLYTWLDGDGGDLLDHVSGGVQVDEALVDAAKEATIWCKH
eukprot:1147266-Pelagomonas_calceolata.AAC.1